jgi:hypothetical protein
VYMCNSFPYFVSTYEVGFIVFSGERPGFGGYTSTHWWHTNQALQVHKNRVLGQMLHEEVWTCSLCTCITGFHTLFLPTKLVSLYPVGKMPGFCGYTSAHWWHTNWALQVHKNRVLGRLLHEEVWTCSLCTCITGFHTIMPL